MNGTPPEDHVRLFPPLSVGGHEISLEVEIHGALVDGNYLKPTERTPAVLQCIRMLYDLTLQHRKKQQEGTA